MPPLIVDPSRIHEFKTEAAFYTWLAKHHASEPDIWIRIFKVASGHPSIAATEAIDAVLCWGWIDGVRKSLDDISYLQRYSPRGRKSVWSQINIQNVERLIAEGRMTQHGLAQAEAAKADGRWEQAYRVKGAEVPEDLQAAIDANPKAKAMFATLTAQNRFALIFRTNGMKTEAGRRKKVADLVAMLERGETPHPQKRSP
jgi:uncharacterized protein YdeI (YjbR/CyaY-like superfamily)